MVRFLVCQNKEDIDRHGKGYNFALLFFHAGLPMSEGSNIFVGHRALGYVSNHVPLVTRYIESRREHLVVTCVGRVFHTYGTNKLGLLSVSKIHPEDITAIAAGTRLHFVSFTCVLIPCIFRCIYGVYGCWKGGLCLETRHRTEASLHWPRTSSPPYDDVWAKSSVNRHQIDFKGDKNILTVVWG